MSNFESKLNKSIVTFLDYTGDTITRNLVVAMRSKKITIGESELKKINTVVKSSIEQSITNGYSSVQKVIKESKK
jgi:hypothetical protein